MSIRGRSVLDWLRRRFNRSHSAPIDSATYWDMTYDKLYKSASATPFEWGADPSELIPEYRYTPVDWVAPSASAASASASASASSTSASGETTATWASTVPPTLPTLILGAGDSRIGEHMHHAGWPAVTNMDFSSSAVDRRRATADPAHAASVRWVCHDARENMRGLLGGWDEDDGNGDDGSGGDGDGASGDSDDSASSSSGDSASLTSATATATATAAAAAHAAAGGLFGSVVDKGLVDGLWLAGDDPAKHIPVVVKRAAEVLDPSCGVFVTLSFTHPDYMVPLLLEQSALEWNKELEVRRIVSGGPIYMYRLTRRDRRAKGGGYQGVRRKANGTGGGGGAAAVVGTETETENT